MHQSVQDILPTYLHISTNFNPHKPKLLEIVQDLIATVAYNYYNYTKLGIGYGDVYIGGKGSWIYFIEESGGDVTEAMYDSELLLFSTQVIIAHWSQASPLWPCCTVPLFLSLQNPVCIPPWLWLISCSHLVLHLGTLATTFLLFLLSEVW